MTPFKNKRRFTEVIIWLIITDFHDCVFTRGLLPIVYARKRANEIHECVLLFSVSHSVTVAILSRALSYFSQWYHCWENFTISQIIYCIQSVKPLTKTKEADFRGAITKEVVKVWKLVSFRSLRPRELLIKKSRVFHIREFFIRRVSTVSLLFISLSSSK